MVLVEKIADNLEEECFALHLCMVVSMFEDSIEEEVDYSFVHMVVRAEKLVEMRNQEAGKPIAILVSFASSFAFECLVLLPLISQRGSMFVLLAFFDKVIFYL